MEFKDRLKFLRTNYHMKLTQIMLAKHLGRGYTVISNYENGRNEPSIKDLVKLADFFNVSVDYLVCHNKVNNIVSNDENYNSFYLIFNSFCETEQEKIIETLKLWKST